MSGVTSWTAMGVFFAARLEAVLISKGLNRAEMRSEWVCPFRNRACPFWGSRTYSLPGVLA